MPMLSIDNTYSLDELQQYGERTAKLLPGEPIEWVVELKIDGVAVSLLYEDGLLVRGVTRGNGRVGDDITHNVRTVGRRAACGWPGEHVPPVLEVRGEIYMTNSDLVRAQRSAAAARASRRSPTRATSRPAASACSTRGSAPSGGCGSSATAWATSRG